MDTALRFLNIAFVLFALFMGIKQGWSMISGKEEMIDLFGKWNIGKSGVMIIGVITVIGALMMLFPKTFVWGNFIMAATILLIIAFHLSDKDWRGVAIELPFFFLSLVITYLQYPFIKQPTEG
jgi:hypothetical protein